MKVRNRYSTSLEFIAEDKMISKNLIPILCGILSILFFVFCSSSFGVSDSTKIVSPSSETKTYTGKNIPTGDTVYVIHFHPTAQCSCCINVGSFSQKSLEKYYTKPYKDGCIIFKECNIDEDSLTAKKYQIFWSALGFTRLSRGKNEFKEIESVWEFCEDEKRFLPEFKAEMDQFLAKSRKDETSTETKANKTVP